MNVGQALDIMTLLSFVLQVGLPLLVGLLTKQSWSSGLKATLLLLLTAVNQYLVSWSGALGSGHDFDWKGYLITVAMGFIVSVGVHFGLLRPIGAAQVAQDTLVKD